MSNPVRLGILGAGQLAQMLARSARKLGYEPWCVADSPKSPAAASGFKTASLAEVLNHCDTLLFENEFVDIPHLRSLAQSRPIRFIPDLEVIEEFQDKAKQKSLLTRLKIPTAPYALLPRDLPVGSPSIQDGVLKWARNGYDGKGVRVLRSPDDLHSADTTEFLKQGWSRGGEVYIEQRADFKRELAMVAVHVPGAPLFHYPLVVSEQRDGICRKVLGPARDLGVAPALEQQVSTWATQLASDRGLVGAFALELFELRDGTLWVNEVAPRVHNSGHYTQDACDIDQFEAHCRAALGLPLPRLPSCEPAFGMINLLGPSGLNLSFNPGAPKPSTPDVRVHWYEKESVTPRRKLGHLNLASSAGIADLDRKLETENLRWENNLRSLA